MIGPSQLGLPCDHCLAAKLAGWTERRDAAWLPTIGTAVHRLLEDYFIQYENQRNANHTTGRRWLTEQAVTVGQVGGNDVTGSTDLLDLSTGVVIDFKLVGANTLKDAKANGPSQQYRVQANLYAKGWNDAGYRVDHVAIAYLPRNSASLGYAHWWTEPHDRQIADDALDRADSIQRNIDLLASLGGTHLDDWIGKQDRDPHCYQCARFKDSPTRTGEGQFAELLGKNK